MRFANETDRDGQGNHGVRAGDVSGNHRRPRIRRTGQPPAEHAEADATIREALSTVSFRAEDHPELGATDSMRDVQREIAVLEERIADRREYYNEAVTSYNTVIKQIPYVWLAGPLGHSSKELFEVPDSETADVDVGAMFDDAGGGETAAGGKSAS